MVPGSTAQFQTPEVNIRDSAAAVSGPFLRQHSFGFQADYILDFKRSFEDESAMLTISIQPESVDGTLVHKSPEFQALARLQANKSGVFWVVFLISIGTFFMSISPEFAKELQLDVLTNHPVMTSFLSKFAGFVLLSIGSYIGFRKLPGK